MKQNCGWEAKNVYISSKSIQAKELWRLFIICIIQFTPCKRGLKFVGNHSSIDARRRSLLYTTQITSFWKERTRNIHFLIKRRDYKHTIKTKKLWRRFSILTTQITPLGKREYEVCIVYQKVGNTDTKFLSFVWNHSDKEAMRMFFYLYHTNHPLGKEGPRSLNFWNKSGDCKHRMSKVHLESFKQRATEVVLDSCFSGSITILSFLGG